jgi:hypothetical protein
MICEQLKKADFARLKVEMRALELGIVCSRPVVEVHDQVALARDAFVYRLQQARS